MSALADSLRRARELYLSGEHRCVFLKWPDWSEMMLAAASGDRALATRALELLDAVAPGADAEMLRLGGERLAHLRRLAESAGEVVPEDPDLHFYEVGLVFDFYARGQAFLPEDDPESMWSGSRIYHLLDRRPSEVAAIIGKACALAESMPEPPKRRFTPPSVPVAIPAPSVAIAVVRSMARDAGYVQDPEEERDDGEN